MSKRTLLWDYTLTRDFQSTQGIQSSAGALRSDGPIQSVANWNTWKPSELPGFLRFQPTVRTAAQLDGSEFDNLNGALNAELARGGEVLLLTFNEPERIPLSAGDAVQLWRERILPLRAAHADQIRLVSPSCASDDAGSAWLAEFMGALGDGERPDYLGAHFYTDSAQDAGAAGDAARAYLSGLHDRYGLALVVSEIASTSRDGANVEQFTHDIAGWMDGLDWVKEYALFGAMRQVADDFVSPAAQLMDDQGNWTSLGRWWAGI